ncbi:MAG: hypothetical protein RIM23_23885, partial [Coleofasciculus sp. G3-WIS-01]
VGLGIRSPGESTGADGFGIHGCIDIGVSLKSTSLTVESRLMPICAVTLIATAALLSCESGLYITNLITFCFSFVSQELLKLIEAPRRYPHVELLVSAFVANTLQILQGVNFHAIKCSQFLAYTVVAIPHEPLLMEYDCLC